MDALKLVTVGREHPDAQLILAFASAEAEGYVTGKTWLAEALRTWGVATRVVEVSDSTRASLIAAQAKQFMVNRPAPR